MKYPGALLFVLITFAFANAQNNQVSGRLTDPQGEPLPGATVHVMGTNTGTITETDGSFTLLNLAPGQHKLIFTYLGLSPDTLPVRIEAGQKLQLSPVALK